MSAYTYLTQSQLITDKPCVLKSVVVANDGSSEAYVDAYDGQAAETGYRVVRCYCTAKLGFQYRWEGLRLSRGLYIEFDSHADHCTVEWEPVGYPKKGKSGVEYQTSNAP